MIPVTLDQVEQLARQVQQVPLVHPVPLDLPEILDPPAQLVPKETLVHLVNQPIN